jgi:E3 ubiquitin-protein ligase UBR1
MSGLSSYFPRSLLSSINNTRDRERDRDRDRDRDSRSGGGGGGGGSSNSNNTSPSDPLAPLRYTLETLPGTRAHVFTPAVRAQLLSELYSALWGPYAQLFTPGGVIPPGALLAEHQIRTRFYGAGMVEEPIPGRACGHIFAKGESCFRCK